MSNTTIVRFAAPHFEGGSNGGELYRLPLYFENVTEDEQRHMLLSVSGRIFGSGRKCRVIETQFKKLFGNAHWDIVVLDAAYALFGTYLFDEGQLLEAWTYALIAGPAGLVR
jgi:hypothetical protein